MATRTFRFPYFPHAQCRRRHLWKFQMRYRRQRPQSYVEKSSLKLAASDIQNQKGTTQTSVELVDLNVSGLAYS